MAVSSRPLPCRLWIICSMLRMSWLPPPAAALDITVGVGDVDAGLLTGFGEPPPVAPDIDPSQCGLDANKTAWGEFAALGLRCGGDTGGLAVWLLRGVSDRNADMEEEDELEEEEVVVGSPTPQPGELREDETDVLREEEEEEEQDMELLVCC